MEYITKRDLLKLLKNRVEVDIDCYMWNEEIVEHFTKNPKGVFIGMFGADRCGVDDSCVIIGFLQHKNIIYTKYVFPRMRLVDQQIILAEDKTILKQYDMPTHKGACNGSQAYLNCYPCSLCESVMNDLLDSTFKEQNDMYPYTIWYVKEYSQIYIETVHDLTDLHMLDSFNLKFAGNTKINNCMDDFSEDEHRMNWRPWTHHKYSIGYKDAIQTLVLLAGL